MTRKELVEEMFDELEKEHKREHPIEWWIDNVLFKGKGLFGYAPHHSLTHPNIILSDLAREVKWAYQRVTRGWDDRVVWSVDEWLATIMPDILKKLKDTKYGIPYAVFEKHELEEDGNVSEENQKIAEERWNNELDKMIAAFRISNKIEDYDLNSNEVEARRKVFERGMASFVKYYNCLWD